MKKRPLRPYPQVSIQKETALLLIQQGCSYRKVAKVLSMNVTIITQWSKRDPEFKKLLDRIEEEKQLRFRKIAFSYPMFDGLVPLADFQNQIERAFTHGELPITQESIDSIRVRLAEIQSLLTFNQDQKQNTEESIPCKGDQNVAA